MKNKHDFSEQSDLKIEVLEKYQQQKNGPKLAFFNEKKWERFG